VIWFFTGIAETAIYHGYWFWGSSEEKNIWTFILIRHHHGIGQHGLSGFGLLIKAFGRNTLDRGATPIRGMSHICDGVFYHEHGRQ